MRLRQEIISTDGIRGTHSHPEERTRMGRLTCSGSIVIQPGKADLDVLLPLITGTTKNAGNAFLNASGLLNETLTPFFVVIDRTSEVATYAGATSTTAGCYVEEAIFHVAEGEPLTLTLRIQAINEYIGAAGSFPAGAVFNYQPPYVWADSATGPGGTFSVGGTVYQFKEATITYRNVLKTDRFMNSTVRTDIPFLDRIVECEVVLPNTTDQAALLAYPGNAATAFTLKLAQGTDNFQIATSAFQIDPESPDSPGREESHLRLHGFFRTSGAGTIPEVTFTNVSA